VTKRYTTPYPAFRQVFALRASEGAATAGRIEVLAVLVNGTAVLGKSLIRFEFCTAIAVGLVVALTTLSDTSVIQKMNS